jgi:hypothetical protein
VKAGSRVHARDRRGLRLLRDSLGERFVVGVVLHTGSHCIRYADDDRIIALPIDRLWTEIAGSSSQSGPVSDTCPRAEMTPWTVPVGCFGGLSGCAGGEGAADLLDGFGQVVHLNFVDAAGAEEHEDAA